jgi:predicted ATP-grasp superfamily ATP-dependent carboligase
MLLVVAALSARMLAESARDAGHEVIALDVFGDRDTRAASRAWWPIGAAGRGVHVDATALCAALQQVQADGWIAGAGCEPHLAAACAAAPHVPLLGNTPAAVAATRDPRTFFAALHELGIAHPETRFDVPDDERGWLVKDFAGSGGWQVHRLPHRSVPVASRCFQREIADAEPVSALFVADGRRADLIGVQRQLARPRAGRPYVFHGVVGPVAPHDGVERVVAQVAERFALRGLNGADFLRRADGSVLLLEINPRPPASLALHERRGSMLRAHLDGHHDRALISGVRGHQIVFAERRCSALERFAPWCHDLPAAGTHIERDDPVCSIDADGESEADVLALLAARRHDVLNELETTP